MMMASQLSASHTLNNQDDSAVIGVHVATKKDREAWDHFVLNQEKSVFFQRYGWAEIIQSTYGYKSYFLYVTRNQNITGIFPLIYVNSALTGKVLVSTAFTVGGGMLALDDLSRKALFDYAIDLAGKLGVRYIETRGGDKGGDNWNIRSATHASFRMTLFADDNENLKQIPRKRRAELRKAFKLVEEKTLTTDTEIDIDLFHKLYSTSLRNLGTPVFPKKFVAALLAAFPDDIEILTVRHNNVPVTSLISFYHHRTVLPYYVGAVPAARSLRAFDYIYWRQIQLAIARDCTSFDFGRSKIDSGPYGYKKTWGINPEELEHQFFMVGGGEIPQMEQNSPKYVMAQKVWKRLPVQLASLGGSILARHFA